MASDYRDILTPSHYKSIEVVQEPKGIIAGFIVSPVNILHHKDIEDGGVKKLYALQYKGFMYPVEIAHIDVESDTVEFRIYNPWN